MSVGIFDAAVWKSSPKISEVDQNLEIEFLLFKSHSSVQGHFFNIINKS